MKVRSRAGAWIETCAFSSHTAVSEFAPARERGLKQEDIRQHAVGPMFAPARERGLKRTSSRGLSCRSRVRSRAGAWIETKKRCIGRQHWKFAPARERGLKLFIEGLLDLGQVRSRAGAWIETSAWVFEGCGCVVRSRAGAWIET